MLIKQALMLIASLIFIALLSTAVAQDQLENDGIAQAVLITARDGQAQELEKAITDYHHYMAGKKGAFRYQWYSILTGPDTGKYIARTGSHNWADFDAKHDWDEEAGAKFTSDVQPYIESADFRLTRTDSNLGSWPESMADYPYILITDWYVKPGQFGAFNAGLKKIDGIFSQAGRTNYIAFVWTVSGGKSGQISLVSPRKSYADMAPKKPSFFEVMSNAMGAEEAQAFLSELGESYKAGRSFMVKYRPKLSHYGDNE